MNSLILPKKAAWQTFCLTVWEIGRIIIPIIITFWAIVLIKGLPKEIAVKNAMPGEPFLIGTIFFGILFILLGAFTLQKEFDPLKSNWRLQPAVGSFFIGCGVLLIVFHICSYHEETEHYWHSVPRYEFWTVTKAGFIKNDSYLLLSVVTGLCIFIVSYLILLSTLRNERYKVLKDMCESTPFASTSNQTTSTRTLLGNIKTKKLLGNESQIIAKKGKLFKWYLVYEGFDNVEREDLRLFISN